MRVELLAPAGDFEKLVWAINYGADAVYFGGSKFNMRANAKNFTISEIKKSVEFAHKKGKKVYVTVNVFMHDEEIKSIVAYLKKLESLNVDAVIISDPAIIKIARENTKLDIHLSTQQSTLNFEAIKFWKKQGIKRIILGRELSKSEIKEITDKTDIEIETFIHGSMCAGYSGRCVLSNIFTNRDANRGGCAQVCRWDFTLLDEFSNAIKAEKPFSLCAKDLSLLKVLPEMIESGITSFKIEGRMRSIYYIATVVSTYRKAIDNYYQKSYKYDKNLQKTLDNCSNRDSIVQFFNKNMGPECQYYNGREEQSNQDFIGVILDYKNNLATIEQRNYFEKGDKVEVFGPKTNIEIVIDKIYDEENNLITIVNHPQQIVKVEIKGLVFKGDLLRIKK